ncbi:unnamed protein product [Strongylus vulgaris]|uniref:Uncharacterized protein n=1 Tax=Strongylus vulgaris TaxID=40348 RepID=A0A3P7IW10_STRVU|nr:unnamed protein product [Strongylus vulgaris]
MIEDHRDAANRLSINVDVAPRHILAPLRVVAQANLRILAVDQDLGNVRLRREEKESDR